MSSEQYQWDFFIAHSSRDKSLAEEIYDQLAKKSRVFLDSRCLELGDDWDLALRDAQAKSLISVVLISANTERAYYQREEIAAAIDLARSGGQQRVVPVYLSQHGATSQSVPYGLRLKHGLTLSKSCGVNEVRDALLELLGTLRLRTGSKSSDDAPPTANVENGDEPMFEEPRRSGLSLKRGAFRYKWLAGLIILLSLTFLVLQPTLLGKDVSIPGGTGWIFAGYFDIERSAFTEGPYVSVHSIRRGVGKYVETGDTVELEVSRPVVIVDFKRSGAEKNLVSPITIGVVSDDHLTGTVLPAGTELVVRDVSEGHWPGNPQAALWLRVVRKPE